MLLGLNLLKKTKDEFLTDLANLAKSQETLIFIDTNILAYLFKLHAGARQEFFDWAVSAINQQRLYLPAWCAGEYLAKVREGSLHSYTPKSKGDDQPRKALEAMLDTAALFVDETVLRSAEFPGSRNDYLLGFRAAIDGLKQYTQAFKHQFDPDKIHAEIEEHLGPAVLQSAIASLCDRAAKEGPSRIEHRLPPGFRDDGKPENRLGDLIVWMEILEYSLTRKADFKQVLFLTNDEKPDWVYAPAKRLEHTRRGTIPVGNINPKLKVIDPRLISEFDQLIGHANVSICTLSLLVQGLSKTDPSIVTELAAAIQIELVANEELPTSTETVTPPELNSVASPDGSPLVVEEAPPPPQPEGAREEDPSLQPVHAQEPGQAVAAPEEAVADAQQNPLEDILPDANAPQAAIEDHIAAVIEREGYHDATYQADAPSQLNEIISSLQSHNWYVQNPAIEKLRAIVDEEFPPTSWFVLGRNIYQAACGNAQKAMDFMANLETRLKRFPDPVARYVLAGMVYEIYFDAQGTLRDSPKAGYLAKPLALLANDEYSDVAVFIRARLVAAGARLYFTPGDKSKHALVIESVPLESEDLMDADKRRQLTAVTLEGRQILVDVPPESDRWLTRYRTSYSAADVVADVSSALSIPRWALSLEMTPETESNVRFVIPDDHWLQPGIVTVEDMEAQSDG